MTEEKLPYDMGNAGDLLKHGVLTEFVRWRLAADRRRRIRFLDLFGGEPQSSDTPEEIIHRLRALSGSALQEAQTGIRDRLYYGSGQLVRILGELVDDRVSVFVSDRDEIRRQRLRAAGLSMLEEAFPGCGLECGYDAYEAFGRILGRTEPEDLIMIDPFADFLKPGKSGNNKAKEIIPRVAEMTKTSTVLLFVLNLNPFNHVGREFDQILEEHLPDAWIMTCPPIHGSRIAGESKYYADVVLASPFLKKSCHKALELKVCLEGFAGKLAGALSFSERGARMLKPEVVKGTI